MRPFPPRGAVPRAVVTSGPAASADDPRARWTLSRPRRWASGILWAASLMGVLALLPLDAGARERALTLIPLVLATVAGIEGLWGLAARHSWVEAALGKALRLHRSPVAGYYAIMALLTFARLEALSLRAAVADARSVPDFVLGELPGCTIEAVFNLLSAAVWFLEWLGAFPVVDAVLVLAGTVMAYRMARWMFVPEGS